MIKRPPKPVSMTLNLAPMVDVMMCLIIFFLLATKLADLEQYAVDLPWAVSAREVDSSELGRRVTIIIRRAEDGDVVAEYVVADWDGRQVTDRVLTPAEVGRLLADRARRAERSDEKLRCVVRADREVMYRHIEVVLRACGSAGISDIVFPANQGQPPEEAS